MQASWPAMKLDHNHHIYQVRYKINNANAMSYLDTFQKIIITVLTALGDL
jgi:hypothetical protein